MTRRDALRFLGAAGVTLGGCKAAEAEDTSAAGAGLAFHCGKADQLSAATAAAPEELRKYEKIVILMMENRSFDHYFGHLSLPTSLGGEGRTDVDGFTGKEEQFLVQDGGSTRFAPFKATGFKIGDIDHEWDACHGQFNGGKMDGFIQMHFADLERQRLGQVANCGKTCAAIGDPMAYYTRAETPVFHQLLDNYSLCDRWFSSVMGPTWPNRFYLHAATSCGIKTNSKMDITSKPSSSSQARTIWHELDDKCISAVNYSMDFSFASGGFGPFNFRVTEAKVFGETQPPLGPDHGDEWVRNYSNTTFEEACAMGCLPTVSIIDPAFVLSPCDDHPPHDVQAGQAFVASVYKLLSQHEEQWKKTLFIITYDEHGSFYDHVAPPSVEEDERPEFRQLGFRVPALVIGPYVKKNYVSHVQYDHTSFLSTITRRLGLTPLNARVAKANDIRDCIDRDLLETAGAASSPIKLASVSLSESRVHESIRNSHGQSELAQLRMGGPASLEQKRRATSELLGVFDRLGTANIRA